MITLNGDAMSESVYLHEKIAEYRHNENIGIGCFIVGVILIIIGLGLANVTAPKVEWFLIIPYLTEYHPFAVASQALTYFGAVLLLFGAISSYYYKLQKSKLLEKLKESEKSMWVHKLSHYSSIYKSVIRLIIALVVLAIINVIITNLPGINILIPGSPVTIATVAGVLIALIMISIVLRFGLEIGPSVRGAVPTVPEAGTVATNLVVIIAVWIAYSSFGGILQPFLRQVPWAYSLIFLAIALVPAMRAVTALMGSVDKWTSLVKGKIPSPISETVTCPNPDCGKQMSKGAKFCNFCGTALVMEVEVKANRCPSCGMILTPSSRFCNNCGTKIT